MCGRISLGIEEKELREYVENTFRIKNAKLGLVVPRYNVAPGQDVVSVISDGHDFRIGSLRWGFVPSFAKDEKVAYRMINAKAETLKERVSYRKSFESKRCVILADGFYEWEKGGKEKQPMRITMNEETVFPIAGLWSTFIRGDGSKLHTCTIIITEANRLLGRIHDRMPVILRPEDLDEWLDPRNKNVDELEKLLVPFDPDVMRMYPVPKIVNHAGEDSPDCIRDISKQPHKEDN